MELYDHIDIARKFAVKPSDKPVQVDESVQVSLGLALASRKPEDSKFIVQEEKPKQLNTPSIFG
jgi:hypothetical protein